jgi:hypothetical protein
LPQACLGTQAKIFEAPIPDKQKIRILERRESVTVFRGLFALLALADKACPAISFDLQTLQTPAQLNRLGSPRRLVYGSADGCLVGGRAERVEVAHHLGDISRQRLGLFLFTRLLASARSLVFGGNMAKRKARGVPDLELRASPQGWRTGYRIAYRPFAPNRSSHQLYSPTIRRAFKTLRKLPIRGGYGLAGGAPHHQNRTGVRRTPASTGLKICRL